MGPENSIRTKANTKRHMVQHHGYEFVQWELGNLSAVMPLTYSIVAENPSKQNSEIQNFTHIVAEFGFERLDWILAINGDALV